MMAAPPSEAGGLQDSVTWPFPAVAVSPVGGPGFSIRARGSRTAVRTTDTLGPAAAVTRPAAWRPLLADTAAYAAAAAVYVVYFRVVMLVASIEAAEALKLLVGADDKIRRTLLSFDLWTNAQAEVAASAARLGCRACERRDFVHLAGEGRPHVTMCGRNSVQIHERHRPVDFAEMSFRLKPHGVVRHNNFVLKFWHDPYEMTLFPDGRAIIKGTTDTALARSLYARYVGS